MKRAALLLILVLLAPVGAALPLAHAPIPRVASPSSVTPAASTLGEGVSLGHLGMGSSITGGGVNGYNISFVCAQPPVDISTARPGQVRASICPNRIVDEDDTLGNPALAVDPIVPGKYSFASLHGQPARGTAPSPLARDGLSHTTFSSAADGADWTDQPYKPPQGAFQDATKVVGLDDDALIDQQRTLHIASLYAWTPSNSQTLNYTILLWKFDLEAREVGAQANQGLTQADYELVSASFSNRAPGSVIDNLWLLEDASTQTLYLFWHERAAPNTTVAIKDLGNVTSWIGGATTQADAVSPWIKVPESRIIAPCAVATNPVLVQGRVTFGCGADAQGEPSVELGPGEFGIRSLETTTGTVLNEGKSPLSQGTPRLAASKGGDLVLLTSRVADSNGTTSSNLTSTYLARTGNANATVVIAQMATRKAGGSWGGVHDFGSAIHNATHGVRAARFNAALYSDKTDTVHLVYIEDTVPAGPSKAAPRWTKQLIVVDRVGEVVANVDLHTAPQREAGSIPSSQSDAFGDTRDSLIRVAGTEYIAFNDYAVIVFASLAETDQRIPPVEEQAPVPPAEPVPVVQAAGVGTAVGVGLGASAAVGAGALLARRVATTQGAGRGKR